MGSPRSGTTWVQAVLSSHRSFASPPETFLFEVLGDVRARHANSPPFAGPRFALSEEQLDRWFAELWLEVRGSLLAARPGTTRVLEKTPSHALTVDLIRSTVPGALFVHVTRNPVDVTRSMLEAAGQWGDRWFPTEIESAVAIWRVHVGAALAAAQPADSVIVRYEELLTGPVAWRPLLDPCPDHRSGEPWQRR